MNLQNQNSQVLPLGPTYDQIKQKWKEFSSLYVTFDSTPQTFYYSLSNLLKLNQAKNVLEIACGAGKLIPQALDLKAPETFYYATDISQDMLNFAKKRLQKHFEKYQSKISFDEWMKKQNLQFGVVNGEEKIPKNIKFDRMICNLVLMLTTDPKKMLLNLYDSAEDGCLLGLPYGETNIPVIYFSQSIIFANSMGCYRQMHVLIISQLIKFKDQLNNVMGNYIVMVANGIISSYITFH